MPYPKTIVLDTRTTLINTAIAMMNSDDANPDVGMGLMPYTAVKDAAKHYGITLTQGEVEQLSNAVMNRRRR